MRNLVRKLGHFQVIILITLAAVISAEILAYGVVKIFSFPYPVPSTPVVTFLVTAILTPFLSWHLLKLLFFIDDMEQKMNHLATYDSMTKLLSRQAFFKQAQHLHDDFQKNNQTYSVCIIDIDNFKSINDTYGHALGDKVLINFGQIFYNVFKSDYTIGRIGGEEFALLLYVDIHKAKQYIEVLQEAITQSNILYKGEHVKYTVSIGIFENKTSNTLLFDNALSKADTALYYAKLSGKNKYIVFSESLPKIDFSDAASNLRHRRD